MATAVPEDLRLVDLDASEKSESDGSPLTLVAAELSIVTELLSSSEHVLKNGLVSVPVWQTERGTKSHCTITKDLFFFTFSPAKHTFQMSRRFEGIRRTKGTYWLVNVFMDWNKEKFY